MIECVPNSFEMSLYWSANMFTNVVTNVITVVCFLDVFAFVLIFFVLLFSILHKARAPQHSLGIVMLDWKECELNEFGMRFYVRIYWLCLWAALCMYCTWQNAGELSHCTDKGTVHVVWPQPGSQCTMYSQGFYNVQCKRGHRGNHWLKEIECDRNEQLTWSGLLVSAVDQGWSHLTLHHLNHTPQSKKIISKENKVLSAIWCECKQTSAPHNKDHMYSTCIQIIAFIT